MPPMASGVADYAGALFGALKQLGDISLEDRNADLHLYHIGNNQLHRAVYRRALQQPGVVILHDAVLGHFFLGCLSQSEYVEEFTFNYGNWHRDLAARLWSERASAGIDSRYYRYPMLRRIAEVSRRVIVHNPGAAQMVRAHCREARIAEIPHLFAPPHPIPAYEVIESRQALGISPGDFLFGVFGYLRESKRLPMVLGAFERVFKMHPRARLLVAGDFVSSDLARAVKPNRDQPGVTWLGRQPERNFWRLVHAIDAGINLRYPSAGETSGITIRLMGTGKLVIMSDTLENSHYPDSTTVRVAPGIAEKAMLEEAMLALVSSPSLARQIGRQAAQHIAQNHQLAQVASSCWSVLRAAAEERLQ